MFARTVVFCLPKRPSGGPGSPPEAFWRPLGGLKTLQNAAKNTVFTGFRASSRCGIPRRPGSFPEGPKRPSGAVQRRPEAPQELPRVPKSPPEGPRQSEELPKSPRSGPKQDASKRVFFGCFRSEEAAKMLRQIEKAFEESVKEALQQCLEPPSSKHSARD